MFLLWPIKLAFKIVELVFAAAIVYLVVTAVQVELAARVPNGPLAVAPKASAIVVLGAAPTDGKLSADAKARLAEAKALYGAKLAPRLVVAGNEQLNGVLGAAASWLTAHGVPVLPAYQVFADDSSTQLRLVATELHAEPPPATPVPVIVVTDAIDALWTEHAAAEDGLAATVVAPSGAPLSQHEIGPLWRETSAVAVGRIIGFGRVTWA
jgi:hypothetical protein